MIQRATARSMVVLIGLAVLVQTSACQRAPEADKGEPAPATPEAAPRTMAAADFIATKVPDSPERQVLLGVLGKRWHAFAYAKGPGSDYWRRSVQDETVKLAIADVRKRMRDYPDTRRDVSEYFTSFTDGGTVLWDRDRDSRREVKYRLDWSSADFRERSIPSTAGARRSTLRISEDGALMSLTVDGSDYTQSFIDAALLL